MDDMKIRELNLPAKPKQTICKAMYKTLHYIRCYPDRQHPEQFDDTEINSRATRLCMRENLGCDAYQFYDVLEITYPNKELEYYTSQPRNFSKLYLNNLDGVILFHKEQYEY